MKSAEHPNPHAGHRAKAEPSHAVKPDNTAPDGGGRVKLDERLRHRVVGKLQKSRNEQQHQRERIIGIEREGRDGAAPQHGEQERGARIGLQAPCFQHHAADQCARCIGCEQCAIGEPRIAMTKVASEFGHLRLIGIGDEKRRRSGQQDHRYDDGIVPDFPEGFDNVGDASYGAGPHSRWRPETRAVGRFPQPQHERQIDQGIQREPVDRSKNEKKGRPQSRSREQSQIPRRRHQTHGGRQLRRTDNVVDQHLARRAPEHAGAAMKQEQHRCVPHLQGIGEDEQRPGDRAEHEQRHADLHETARIESVGECTSKRREQKKRQPMREHGEAAERRGLEFLERDPVGDDVFDAVGHHGQSIA